MSKILVFLLFLFSTNASAWNVVMRGTLNGYPETTIKCNNGSLKSVVQVDNSYHLYNPFKSFSSLDEAARYFCRAGA